MVSKCCLKFLSNKICSYWINGTLVNIIAASGSGGLVTVDVDVDYRQVHALTHTFVGPWRLIR